MAIRPAATTTTRSAMAPLRRLRPSTPRRARQLRTSSGDVAIVISYAAIYYLAGAPHHPRLLLSPPGVPGNRREQFELRRIQSINSHKAIHFWIITISLDLQEFYTYD